MRPHRPAATRLSSVRVARAQEREGRRVRRIGSLALAGLALAGLVALLVAPPFHIHEIDVSGNQRLTAAQVVAAAGLEHPGSVFQVDSGQVERSTWPSGSRRPCTGRPPGGPGTCRPRRWPWGRRPGTRRGCWRSTGPPSPSRGPAGRRWTARSWSRW
ncbi:MAG: FtsQ-type POTRA domain-containing protein [Chloroflexi bacterium]|nr:MAG: FtsQ-type POTRA domain-containing protein [Chloroflexota bacterium]